jgi:hypothetical protein
MNVLPVVIAVGMHTLSQSLDSFDTPLHALFPSLKSFL